ncbi:hypothetical protein FB45DRAFT_1048746 [Roridomyces roridus]|uniref:Uncharacterized protein n=1 Tax=Roridomyces roridus TaxID=1738132 RepID=A0AAD7F838_9AGAR|nr:hypothetical protein FB45DRAFT_1048746 [Roridomyces roridus]
MPIFRCQYCGRSVNTAAGVNRHIGNTPACRLQWAKALGAIVVAREEQDDEPAPAASPAPSPPLSPVLSEDDNDLGVGDDFVLPPRVDTPPPPELVGEPRSHRASIEEVLDEDDPAYRKRFVEPFPGDAGTPSAAPAVLCALINLIASQAGSRTEALNAGTMLSIISNDVLPKLDTPGGLAWATDEQPEGAEWQRTNIELGGLSLSGLRTPIQVRTHAQTVQHVDTDMVFTPKLDNVSEHSTVKS